MNSPIKNANRWKRFILCSLKQTNGFTSDLKTKFRLAETILEWNFLLRSPLCATYISTSAFRRASCTLGGFRSSWTWLASRTDVPLRLAKEHIDQDEFHTPASSTADCWNVVLLVRCVLVYFKLGFLKASRLPNEHSMLTTSNNK